MKTTIMKAGFVSLVAAAAGVASASTTIHVDSVTQRWPWNNKVDITYTVTGGQDVSASKYYKIVFTTVINGTTYTIDGSTLGASANTDTHTVTWIAPTGLRCANCTMSAAIYDSDVPSGNDYMIVDLATGDITYEGLFATQDASNARYNTDVDGSNIYKETKLVLRKVPAGGPYVVLGDWVDASVSKTKSTDRDYYIGIYPVTQKQYETIGADAGATPSIYKTEVAGNPAKHRPVERVSWIDLRTDIASTSSIPLVASAGTGTFFQRLCYKTGNVLAFDLPTDVMFNLAAHAGVTTRYFYGSDTADSSKYVCAESSGDPMKTMFVGSKPANAWGLYDVSGNVWERGRDTCRANASTFEWLFGSRNVFTPRYNTADTTHTLLGGNCLNVTYNNVYFRLDYYGGSVEGADNANQTVGFRVAVVMD